MPTIREYMCDGIFLYSHIFCTLPFAINIIISLIILSAKPCSRIHYKFVVPLLILSIQVTKLLIVS